MKRDKRVDGRLWRMRKYQTASGGGGGTKGMMGVKRGGSCGGGKKVEMADGRLWRRRIQEWDKMAGDTWDETACGREEDNVKEEKEGGRGRRNSDGDLARKGSCHEGVEGKGGMTEQDGRNGESGVAVEERAA